MKPVGSITTVLGFHGLLIIRDKIHLLLEICIFFFIFDISESLIVLLFA